MNKMRILVVNWRDIRHPEAGGAELYVQNICSELVKMGHEVYLHSSSFPGAMAEEEIDGVKIFRSGGRFTIYWFVFKHYINYKARYDVIIESINTIPFFMPLYVTQPLASFIYSTKNRLALIEEIGITPISLVAWLANYLIPFIYSRKVMITISETTRNELVSNGFDASRLFVAKPGVGIDFERLVESIQEPTRPNFRVVYIGRLKKYKRIEIILKAVAILRRSMPIELIIVGHGDYLDSLRRQVVELGLTGCVRFAGFVNEAEKVAILKSSSVFVCCSIDEGGWTIAGLEALRCGVPLVLTDSQRDLVQLGITGFITPPQPEIVADKIRAVLEGDWKNMSFSSYLWSKNYTWKNAAIDALNALSSAINKHT